MENSGFSQAFVAHTEINSERYSLTNRLAEKMTAPVEGMRSDSDASLRSVRLRHHFDVRIAVLVPRCAGRVMAARIGPRSTAPFEHWQRRTQRAGEDEWVTRRTDLRGKSPLPFPPTPSASIAGERCRSRSIRIGGAAPASGRGAKHSDRFHRRCGLPLPATFGSEVQTPTNRPHCPQRHGRGSRHNLHGSLGLRGRANKPSANLFEPLSLGREVVESVARDHQCRTTLNSTYLQDLEDERLI